MIWESKITGKAVDGKGRDKKSPHPLSRRIHSPLDHILHLQRKVGNQAVQSLFMAGILQANLGVGQANDRYEREADRVADEVMRMPKPGMQMKPT